MLIYMGGCATAPTLDKRDIFLGRYGMLDSNLFVVYAVFPYGVHMTRAYEACRILRDYQDTLHYGDLEFKCFTYSQIFRIESIPYNSKN